MAKVVHFEIPSEDPARSVAFYSSVFGWKLNRWGDTEYYLTDSGPKEEPGIEGAILRKNHPVTSIVNTIQVKDIVPTMNAIEENGGEIFGPKQEIPGVGIHCYFKDPDGHIHGVLEPE